MPNITRFISIFLGLLLFSSFPAGALHIKGGWMSYQYLGRDNNGNLRYQFTIKVFRDCGVQSPGQNDAVINVTVFRNDNFSQEALFAAPQSRIYTLRKTTFSPCISPIPDVCYVVLEYSGIVSLPPNPQGYTAAFQRCCRIDGIVNVSPPSNNLGNTYSIRLPGSVVRESYMENNSPIFVEKDTAIVCFRSSFTLDYSATDPDGDSLVYEFAPAIAGGSTNNPAPVAASAPPYSSLPYINPYSANNPFGTNISLDPRTGLITGTAPNATGEYVLAVLVKEYRDGTLIAESRKELHVNVANCSLPEAVLPPEIINCTNLTVDFENNSPSAAVNSYYWDFGVAGNTTTVVRPTFTFPDTGTYVVKLVVNRGQACSDSTNMRVKIYPGFEPGFIADGSCFSNPFNFLDTTYSRYGTVNSWRWDFGNTNATNDTSRTRNPAYTYPAPGTYAVTLQATSSLGCNKTVTVPLQVLDRPLLSLPFKDTLICSIDSLQLRAIGNGNFSWAPSPGRIFNQNTATPTVYPLTTTTYTVTLNDRGCVTSDSVRVNVLDFITVDAGPDTTICLGDQVTLLPITAGLGFRWSPAATLSDPDIKNPIATPTAASTTYTVIANLGKCQSTDQVTIRAVPYPQSFAGRDTSICFGDIAFLQGSGNGNRFQWTPIANVTNSNSPLATARPTATTTYTLSVFDNRGCPKPGISTVVVTVIPAVVINAGRDTSMVVGQPLQLAGQSNAPQNIWSPALGLNNTSSLNPVLTLLQTDLSPGLEYINYRLTGTTPEGCTAFDDIRIRIFSTGPSIFVPNAFTPNGDGLNDNIRPILAGIQRLDYFKVYNRFGQLIFQSNEPESAWDGRVKGQPQASGNYAFVVQAVDYTGEVLRQSGSFILIR